MLYVIDSPSIDDIYKFTYLKESEERQNLIVCPHPESSDSCRSILEELGISKIFDVVTISKFVSDEFKLMGKELNRQNKASLLTDFAIGWKKLFGPVDHRGFMETFDIFTDLRSFTTDITSLKDVFEYFDEKTQKALYFFWNYFENSGLYDEHGAYEILTQFYSELKEQNQNITSDKNIIFLDFYHLSGTQIILLKRLALRNDVYVPIPCYVLKYALLTDWVHRLTVQEPPKSHDPYDSRNENIYLTESGRMSEILTQYFKINQKLPRDLLVLDEKDAERAFMAYPIKKVFYKKDAKLFDALLSEMTFFINQFDDKEDISDTITDYISTKLKIALRAKIYYQIKFYNNFIELLNYYKNLAQDTKIFKFDLHIIMVTHELNLPRVSSIPILLDGHIKLTTLSKSWAVKINDAHVLAFASSSLKTKIVDRYPKELAEMLSYLGPIRNNRLDKLFQINTLKEAVYNEQNKFFIEERLLESDPGWVQIVGDNFCRNELTFYITPYEKKLDPLNVNDGTLLNKLEEVSTTKLQTYLDCPRKYYHSYIDKIVLRPKVKTAVDPALRGTMFHEFIESYFNKYKIFLAKSHEEYCQHFFEIFLNKYELSLNSIEKNSLKVSLFNRTFKVCELISEFQKDTRFKIFSFEKEIQDENKDLGIVFKGSVDLYIEFDDGIGIIDFKSSKNSIPSFNSIRDLKKIQTLFYSKRAKDDNKKIVFLAYLNLTKIEDSLFLSNSDDWNNILEKYGIKNNNKSLEDIHERYDIFEVELIQKIKNDQTFAIKPVSTQACQYCPAKLLCPKENLYDKGIS